MHTTTRNVAYHGFTFFNRVAYELQGGGGGGAGTAANKSKRNKSDSKESADSEEDSNSGSKEVPASDAPDDFRTRLYAGVAAGLLVLAILSWVFLSLLELLSYLVTLLVWWYVAYDTSQIARDANESLAEIEQTMRVMNPSGKSRSKSSGSSKLNTTRRLISMVETALRGKIAFWLVSAVWCGVISVPIPLVQGYLSVSTPLVLALALLLGPGIGNGFMKLGGMAVSGSLGSLIVHMCSPSPLRNQVEDGAKVGIEDGNSNNGSDGGPGGAGGGGAKTVELAIADGNEKTRGSEFETVINPEDKSPVIGDTELAKKLFGD